MLLKLGAIESEARCARTYALPTHNYTESGKTRNRVNGTMADDGVSLNGGVSEVLALGRSRERETKFG